MRCLPGFYIGGIYKGGTTDLFYHLSRHPLVFPGMCKEPLWDLWNTGSMAPFTINDYIGLFDSAALQIQNLTNSQGKSENNRGLTFEATSVLLHMYRNWKVLPWNRDKEEPVLTIADHLKVMNPNAKFIFLLRDPVSWLESCYNFFRYNYQTQGNFSAEDVHVRVETDINSFTLCQNKGGFLNKCVYSYNADNCSILNALYYAPIKRWITTIGQEKVLSINSANYFHDRRKTLDIILQFLQLPSELYPINNVVNKAPILNKRKHFVELQAKTKRLINSFMNEWNIKLADLTKDESFKDWNQI